MAGVFKEAGTVCLPDHLISPPFYGWVRIVHSFCFICSMFHLVRVIEITVLLASLLLSGPSVIFWFLKYELLNVLSIQLA